jgi:hypothetical protein
MRVIMSFGLRPCSLFALAAVVLTAPASWGADESVVKLDSNTEVVPEIVKCLQRNKEAVLLTHGVACKDYRRGNSYFAKELFDAPFEFESIKDCAREVPGQVNARRLDTDAIQALAHDKHIGSHGIRIIGAIFCQRLDLIGLVLPFSLVLDHAAFKEGIELRNADINGDLSLGDSILLNQLRIIRSRIRGSLFADNSFIDRISMGNTTIDNSVSLNESLLFKSTEFYNVQIAKELSVRGSALSYFITQFSSIGEILDLSHSEARCAYHINKSNIGYLVARRAGFGAIAPAAQEDLTHLTPPGYYVWRDDLFDTVAAIHSSPSSEIRTRIAKQDSCTNEESKKPYRAEFFVFDNNIKSSLCISEFRWLGPRDKDPYTFSQFLRPQPEADDYLRTVVAINGNVIGNNLIIDLWPNHGSKKSVDEMVDRRLHRLEAIGVKAGGLIIDFTNTKQNHTTAVDGIQFERLYSAHASCEYGGSESAPPIYNGRTLSIIADLAETLVLPKVDDALRWLDLNTIGSTQPYTAFAVALRNAGVDGTRITIARENREICERAARWLPLFVLRQVCPDAAERRESHSGMLNKAFSGTKALPSNTPTDQNNGWDQLRATILSIPNQLSDLALLAFQGVMFVLADHGYRPGKVLWWVTLTLIAFWIWFVGIIKVVAYSSKSKTARVEQRSQTDVRKISPLGFAFLFDRLLPAYQIDNSHYEIESYFRRIPLSQMARKTRRGPAPLTIRRLLFLEWPIERITKPKDVERIENSLRVLRILGVVFALFLAAAVSALIIH